MALQACLPEVCGVIMYPLQLLTGNVPLAAISGMLATNLQLGVVGRELASAVSIPNVSEMPVPLTGTKWHCTSDQEVSTVELDITPRGHPTQNEGKEDQR